MRRDRDAMAGMGREDKRTVAAPNFSGFSWAGTVRRKRTKKEKQGEGGCGFTLM